MTTIKQLLTYVRVYWMTATLLLYMAITTLLSSYSSFDFTVPCFIKYFTGHACYGCGLTTAVTHLLRMDPVAAYQANALVFIVLPVLCFLIVRHWLRFQATYRPTSN